MSGDGREQQAAEALQAYLEQAGYPCYFTRHGEFPDFSFTLEIEGRPVRWAVEETTLHQQFGEVPARRPAQAETAPFERMCARLRGDAASLPTGGFVLHVSFPVRSPLVREIEARARTFIQAAANGGRALDDDGNVTIKFDSRIRGLICLIGPSPEAPDPGRQSGDPRCSARAGAGPSNKAEAASVCWARRLRR